MLARTIAAFMLLLYVIYIFHMTLFLYLVKFEIPVHIVTQEIVEINLAFVLVNHILLTNLRWWLGFLFLPLDIKLYTSSGA